MHPQSVTVWGFWTGGAIGLFFLENAGRAIDDVRYRDVII